MDMKENTYRALFILGAVVTILIVGYALRPYLLSAPQEAVIAADPVRTKAIEQASTIGVKSRSGELDGAISAYDAVMASTTQTLAQKSSSVLLGAGLRYRRSGSSDDAVSAIRDLKRVAIDPAVSAYSRAYAMLEMTLILTASNRDPIVFEELFSGQPWSGFLVSEDGTTNNFASTQQLLARSLQLSSNYRTAIALAANYARELQTKGESFTGAQNNIDGMEIHLAQAEDLARLQSDEQPDGSDRYENYLSNRAFVIATLAEFKGSPYRERYRQTYEDLFTFFLGQQTEYADAHGRLAYEHVMFARALLRVEGDSAGARDQLNNAIRLTNEDPLKEQSALLKWIRTALRSEQRQVVSGFNELLSVSPEFSQFVDTVR